MVVGCLVNLIFMGRGAPREHESAVANFGGVPITVSGDLKLLSNGQGEIVG